jgi:type IV pilus assembly protein PilV
MSTYNGISLLNEKKVSDEKGFSILESLIAISIFAIGLLAVASLLITASSGNRVGNAYSTATKLAQMQIEALKSEDINSPALTAMATIADPPYADPNNPINEEGANGGIFTRTWTIFDSDTTPVPTSPLPPRVMPLSRLISVTVVWDKGTVVMSTFTRGRGN